MRQRIQKVLAHAGVDSRRHCEELVLQGRVEVNGKVVRKLPVLVDPHEDVVKVDGKRVKVPGVSRDLGGAGKLQHAYIILNKPAGVYSTNVSQTTRSGEQLRAIDLLPPGFRKRVYPVGRLDASSRGLLILTDDGDLTHKLTHPSYGVPKTYKVVCDGEVTPHTIERLQHGVWLADPDTGGFKTKPAFIKIVRRGRDQSTLEMTIKEGKNRQVRRMLAQLGHKVRDLRRTRIGPILLKELPEGSSRLLTPREVRELREAAERGKKPAAKKPRGAPK